MFGLMKPRHCSQTSSQRREHRLHYCGTCKTIGRHYGQRTRLLLNHDTVFLAELLTGLSGDAAPAAGWNRAYQSHNCFHLPASSSDMPLALQFAATANVVLTQVKLADCIQDSKQHRWRMAEALLEEPARRAFDRLRH
jgi:Family of unknown function (DUF5685)